MSALTLLARGKPCFIRLPTICNGNAETTVLAHYRLSGISGTGLKPPDIVACPSCSDCHDAADRRRYTDLDREYVRLAHAEGILRWLAWLAGEDHI